MNNKVEFQNLHRAFIALAFLIVFAVHAMTVQPSVPFWDNGERLNGMTWQQIPHPPGAPLFMLIGKFVQTIIPFGDLGWRGNMISVIASGAVVSLLYMMTVIVIRNFRKEGIETIGDAVTVYGAAFIGALSFGFTATFWFNSVEAETYVTSLLVVTLVMYLMMRWTQVADEKGHEKYILLSVYLVGLAIGIHQLSLLVIFTIVLIVYVRKYEITPKSFLALTVIGLLVFFFVFKVIVLSLPAFLAGRTATRNEAFEFAINNSFALQVATVAGIAGLCYLFYWAYKKGKGVLALSAMAFLSIVFAYTVYAQVLIRANANPPMNQNAPKNFSVLASYIGREQYGSAPMWPRRYQTEDYFIAQHNRRDEKGNYVYGVWNPPGRKAVSRSDGSQIGVNDWNNINTAGELNYLWKYQMNHMYFRYFFWNYVGRMSDVQDEGVAWFNTKGAEEANYKTGNAHIFPVQYFALPLLLGLIGLYFHFKRDPKMALVFLAAFLVMGVLAAMYQNQQNPQPRERDYFYLGSYLVFGMWIGLGAYALIDMFNKKKTVVMASIILFITLLAVPLNLLASNYVAYGRAGNYLPFDYAYNILQSVEQDAIIFTNGDNDTFPVWFMQDVEGVRRDVRIANLSLGNTLWYIDQLKNREPWGAKKVPLSFSDESLRADEIEDANALTWEFGPAKTDRITVAREILAQFTNDEHILNAGAVTMTFQGRSRGNDDRGNPIFFHRVQDKLIRDIIITNKFERPVYFLATVGGDAKAGLEAFLRTEGLVQRICPVPQRVSNNHDAFNEEVMDAILLNIDNSNNFSKTQQYGLKLRNLNNPNVIYDETARRTIMMTYPEMFIGYASYLIEVKGDAAKAEKIMDTYLENIPLWKIPLPLNAEYRIANIYNLIGNKEKTEQYARIGLQTALGQIANENLEPNGIQFEMSGRFFGPFQFAAELHKMLGEFEQAKHLLEQLSARMQQYVQRLQGEEAQRVAFRIAALKLSAEELLIDKHEFENNLEAALAEAKRIEASLLESEDMFAKWMVGSITERKNELEIKLGLRRLDTVVALQ